MEGVRRLFGSRSDTLAENNTIPDQPPPMPSSPPTSPGTTKAGAFGTRSRNNSGRFVPSRSNTSSSFAWDKGESDGERSRSSLVNTSPPTTFSSRRDDPARPQLPSLAKAISASDSRVSPSPSTGNPTNSTWKNATNTLNTRDELLMGLLATQAVVDSKESEILSAEEVDELKREQAQLASRTSSLTKKLALETKIRDASGTLSRLNQSGKGRENSLQSSEQLDAANLKVNLVQQELWRVTSRASEVSRRLLEHRAAVLSFSVRRFERKEAKASSNPYAAASDSTDESESSTGLSNGEMSPASTTATSLSVGASRAKFEGAHLFAGHADAYVPTLPTTPQAMAAALKGLSEKLKEASGALVATKRERDALKAEVEMIGLEKTEIETNLSLELQSAEESIHSLEEDLRGVHEERKVWERDKAAMEAQLNQVREERQVIESEGVGQSQEVILARDSLKALCRANRIVTPLMASDLMTFVTAIEGHLAEGNKLNADRHEELNSSLEEARREIKQMEAKLKEQAESRPISPPITMASVLPVSSVPAGPNEDYDRILRPLWSILPSVEARAQKLGSAIRPNGTPRSPKSHQLGHVKSAENSPSLSLSELDVRSLKSLYSGAGGFSSPGLTGDYNVEEFARRVQALVNDDRALVERLIRFAGAHDLLKSNAERAQKLAHDSALGLDTYQKQVKTLEERNASLINEQTALMDELEDLNAALEQLEEQKRELEDLAAEQAETCKNLTEANDTLSAQTLTLAAEAADGPAAVKSIESRMNQIEAQKSFAEEQLRKVDGQNKSLQAQIARMEVQLADASKNLREANSDLDRIRSAESAQRVALLDELNAMQMENGALRNQLRSRTGSK